jgi:CheY-like chemotaxis protein
MLKVHDRRPRVLIVEDDRPLADMYRTALRFEGFDVDSAGDGIAALWHIEQHRPDVVVLDLQLPQLRGEAVLNELASSPELCSTPVIVVTGDEMLTDQKPSAVLHKPCAPDRLISVIEHYVSPGWHHPSHE